MKIAKKTSFRAIKSFVKDASSIYGEDFHELKLYNHILERTDDEKHKVATDKHLKVFCDFCIDQRSALLEKNIIKLEKVKIYYSTKIYIDIGGIIKVADDDTRNAIWKHLLTISALLDPAAKAKEILKNDVSNESNLIADIIKKVESNIDISEKANPLEAVSSLMDSDVFGDLIAGMNSKLQDGSIDLSKLLGTVEKLCSKIEGDDGGSDGKNLFSMLKNFIPVETPREESIELPQ
jgi:hypothetical protein